MERRPLAPAWDPEAQPRKLRCRGRHVYGFLYPDGTFEALCRQRECQQAGKSTRHVFVADTDVILDLYPERTGTD